MSEKLLRIFTCDVCGEEFMQNQMSTVRIPTWSDVSDEDGRFVGPCVIVEKMDLCDECIRKAAVVRRGFRCVQGFSECPPDANVYSHNRKTTLKVDGIRVEER